MILNEVVDAFWDKMQRNEILEALAKKKREYARLKKKLERSVRAARVKAYVQKKVDELSAKPPSPAQSALDDDDHLQPSSAHLSLEASILSLTEQQGSSLQGSLCDQSSSSIVPGSDTKSGSLEQTEICKSLSFNSDSVKRKLSTQQLVVPNDNLVIPKTKEQTQAYGLLSSNAEQEFPDNDDETTKHRLYISTCNDVKNACDAETTDRRNSFSKRKDSQCIIGNPVLPISVSLPSQSIKSFHLSQEGIKLAQEINPATCQKSIDNNIVHESCIQAASAFAKSPKSPVLRENKDCSPEMKENIPIDNKRIKSKDFLHSDCGYKCSNLADGNRIDIEDAKTMLLDASQKAGLDKCGITKISCSQLSLCEYGILDTDFSQSSVFLESQAVESEDLLVEPLQTKRRGRKRKNSSEQPRRTSQRLALKESSQGSSQTSDHSWVTSWSQDSQSVTLGTNYPILLPTCSQGLSQVAISLTQENHPQISLFPKLPLREILNKNDVSFSLPEVEFGSLMRNKINDSCKCDLPDTESMENTEVESHPIPTSALASDGKVQLQLVQGVSKESKEGQGSLAKNIPWLLYRKISSNSDMSPGLFSTPDDSLQRMSSLSPDLCAAKSSPAAIAPVSSETDTSCDRLLKQRVSESGKSTLKYLGSLKLGLKDIQHLLYGSKEGKMESEILCCVSRNHAQLWSASRAHLSWNQSASWILSQSLSIERAHLLSCSETVVLLLVCADEESVSVKLLTYNRDQGTSKSVNIALDITMHNRISSCCLSEKQFVIGISCNNCTRVNKYSITETHHELENKYELPSVDCNLQSLSTIQGQKSALLGISSKCILIWNHDVGHLLMSIPMPDALSPFTCHCLSPVYVETGFIFLPLLYTSRASSAGCMVACNPSKKRTKVLFEFHVPANFKPWAGVQDGGVSGEMLYAIDSHHTLYLWEVFSGRLQYRRENTRTVGMNNRHIVTASTTDCVHIHGR